MSTELFIDSDVILDVLTNRNDFYEFAAEIFDLGYEKKLKLYTSAVVLANVFYILRKKYGIEKSKEQLRILRLIVDVLPINAKTVDSALDSKFGDFEDGLQYFSAKENKILTIITRNIKDYKEKDVVVQSSEEYLRVNRKYLLEE